MIMIADGAMGTQLLAAGLEPGGCGELLNLEQPEMIARIHHDYVSAGASIILTNTFGGSRPALERHGLGDLVGAINESGAAVARAAAAPDTLVLGDIGPFGGFLEPAGDTPRAALHDAFAEQAHALLAGGAHGIMIETMGALDEIEVAVLAARAAGADFIAASVSFERTLVGLRTLTGATPRDAALWLTDLGVSVMGTNCGTGLGAHDYSAIVREYRQVNPSARVLVKMNAGAPDNYIDVESFGVWVRLVVDAGADIVGGCCGTTPQHIEAARRAVRQSDVMMKSGAPSNFS